MNHIMIAGNLAADPEVRYTSQGQKVSTVRVAVNNRRGKKEETLWWRVTFWGETLDKLMQYLKKGSSVIIMGEMNKPEMYTDKNGQPQISLNMTGYNLTFSPFGKPASQQTDSSGNEPMKEMHDAFHGMGGNEYAQVMRGQGQQQEPAFSDDEIPF